MTTVRTAEKVNVKVMNQSQYDQAVKDPTNLYVITDAQLSYNDLTDKLNFIEVAILILQQAEVMLQSLL